MQFLNKQMEQVLTSWLREQVWSIDFSPVYHHKYSTWHIVGVYYIFADWLNKQPTQQESKIRGKEMKNIRQEIQVSHDISTLIFRFYSLGNREPLKIFIHLIMSFKQEEKNNCGFKTVCFTWRVCVQIKEKIDSKEKKISL